jgi:nucleoside-diphosphate-sugar epimerase
MSPKNFIDNQIAILDANSLVIRNLLELAVKNEAKFLHFSSSVVYGLRDSNNIVKKVKENEIGQVDQLSARSAYDEGKRFSETMVKCYREVYNLDAKIIRLFRVFGPRMSLNDDQMIPDLISAAVDNRDMEIFGDSKFSSSFCYVEDIIDAACKMMSSEISGPINIGSDVDVNITDLANIIIKETESTSKIIYVERKLFMSELLLPDIYQAKNELGWMPIVTLENGIKKTIFSLQASNRLQGFNG